jgi:hypothetical protein
VLKLASTEASNDDVNLIAGMSKIKTGARKKARYSG